MSINFENLDIPKMNQDILSLYNNTNKKINVFIQMLDLYSNSLNQNLIDKILSDSKSYNQIVIQFCESAKIYLENIKILKTNFLKLSD